jgi:tripartite-type tricarboxylate transporter receptor subunit TctC
MIGRIAVACLFAVFARSAMAQGFPDRPIRVITPFAAGNTLDTALRIVSDEIRKAGGQPIVIENRPGGSGFIAAQAVAQAAPDGYTLLLGNTSMLTVNPHTFKSLPYDTEKSFRSVTNFLGATMVFAANASVPAANLAEFIAYAKQNPGKTNFASFTAGNSSHFAGVILNQRAGIDMLHVPFNGTPPAVQNLVGGQVQTAFLPALAVRPHIASGKVKVFASTGPRRGPPVPDVPTFKELGFPELEIYIWSSIQAPAGTPDAVIQKLNADFGAALRTTEVRERWATMGFEPLPSTPAELDQFMRTESKRWGDAVRVSGFKAAE